MGFLTDLFGPASGEKFAKLVMRELQRQGETRTLRFDASSFSITVRENDKDSESIFLGNCHSKYCSARRGERSFVIEDFIAAIRERVAIKEPESFEEARLLLMPSVRSLTFFSCSTLQIRLQDRDGSLAPLAVMPGEIGITLVLDYPSSVRYLPPKKLEEWGVGFDEALETAKASLRRRSTERFEVVQPGVYVSPWHDTYDAARLLLPELFTRLEVDGDPVVLAPHRDLVIVTGSRDRDGLAAMGAIGLDSLGEPYPVSPKPLVLRGFEWSEFVVDGAADASAAFQRIALGTRAGDYTDQQKLLQATCEQKGEDVFVASFFATEHSETKRLSSFCAWSMADVQWIPEAEQVSFVWNSPDGREPRSETVPWQRVRMVIGSRMEKLPEVHPPRWKVEGFPTEEEMQRMLE